RHHRTRNDAGFRDPNDDFGVVFAKDFERQHPAQLPKEGPIDLQDAPRGPTAGGGTHASGGSHCGFYIASVSSRKLFSPHGFLASPVPRGGLVGRKRRSQTTTSRLSQRGVSARASGGLRRRVDVVSVG